MSALVSNRLISLSNGLVRLNRFFFKQRPLVLRPDRTSDLRRPLVHLLHSFCPDYQRQRNVPLCSEGSCTPRPEGHISPFQAFCISTASRVGVGNIAGIAIAVVTGGPGAIFWMWVIATLGATSGFIESTLAQIYKVKKPGGVSWAVLLTTSRTL